MMPPFQRSRQKRISVDNFLYPTLSIPCAEILHSTYSTHLNESTSNNNTPQPFSNSSSHPLPQHIHEQQVSHSENLVSFYLFNEEEGTGTGRLHSSATKNVL